MNGSLGVLFQGFFRYVMLLLAVVVLSACGGSGGEDPVDDSTPPDTSISSGPASLTNITDAEFVFAATEAGSSFECSLDNGAFADCTSPQSYTGLSEDTHIFRVRATDTAGNTDATPATYNWQIDSTAVDTTPPDTTVDSGPASATNATTASLTFSATEMGSSFECALDGSSWSACTSPKTFSGMGEGSHTFRVRATDAAGNTDATPATRNWQIDLTPPNTTVSSGPGNPTNDVTASFIFTATETGSNFECALDSGSWSVCTSPKAYTGLGEGSHTFRVRATDTVGNTDASPASFDWQIDLTPPDTTLSSGPDSLTNATSASFVFTATETGSTFECALDGGAYATCVSPKAYSGLGEGSHDFRVRAIDAAGNTEVTPAGPHNWVVDTTPPETYITSAPTSPVDSADASFSIAASETGSTFECALDGGAYTDCSDPGTFTGLSEGSHNFSVRATDPAGNTDATPASHDWVVDTTPPVVTAPAGITVIAADASGSPIGDPDIQVFLAAATATDDNDGDLTSGITHDAPAVFPIGVSTIVTFTVSDAAGNTGSDSASVEVIAVDNIKPGSTSIIINNNAQYAVVTDELSARLSASDNVGVTAYLVTEHNATDGNNILPPVLEPLLSDPRWVKVAATTSLTTTIQYPLTGTYNQGDTVQLCAWFMDEQGNVSAESCDTITYTVTWESGWGNWYADNGVWQIGIPIAGPTSCYSGTQCAATVLDGNYPAYTDSRLISPAVQLASINGNEEIHLRFQHWFSYGGYDSGQVQVSVWDATTSTWGDWVSEGIAVVDNSDWTLKDVELTAYAGETIRLGFYHTATRCSYCGGSEGAGWYIDGIEIVTKVPAFTGDFEAGIDDWSADRGVWQVGMPTAGPAACYGGSTQCVGTILDGNYPAYTDSRLVSATMTLPTVTGFEEIHLRFQHWFSYGGYDSGQVQVSVWDATTSTWGDWVSEGIAAVNTSGGWTQKDVILTAYAGERVRIAFYHAATRCSYCGGSESTGWYIDDVTIQVF